MSEEDSGRQERLERIRRMVAHHLLFGSKTVNRILLIGMAFGFIWMDYSAFNTFAPPEALVFFSIHVIVVIAVVIIFDRVVFPWYINKKADEILKELKRYERRGLRKTGRT